MEWIHLLWLDMQLEQYIYILSSYFKAFRVLCSAHKFQVFTRNHTWETFTSVNWRVLINDILTSSNAASAVYTSETSASELFAACSKPAVCDLSRLLITKAAGSSALRLIFSLEDKRSLSFACSVLLINQFLCELVVGIFKLTWIVILQSLCLLN